MAVRAHSQLGVLRVFLRLAVAAVLRLVLASAAADGHGLLFSYRDV